MKKRTAIYILVLTVLWLSSGLTGGLPSYQEMCKDLKDLPGWEARQCTGMSVDAPQGQMTMAMRTYNMGDRQLQVSVVVGAQAAANWGSFQKGITVDTPEQFFKTIEVDGFPVGISYSKKNLEGAIVVCLKQKAGKTYGVLTVAFRGLPWEEALKWSKEFPWKGLAEKVK